MAPYNPQKLLIWTLPTAIAIASYLWFKKKRIGVQSDPGDNQNLENSINNNKIDKEKIKTTASSSSSIKIDNNKNEELLMTTATTTPNKLYSRSLSGVDTPPIDIIIPRELRSTRSNNPIVISDEDLDLEIEKMKSRRYIGSSNNNKIMSHNKDKMSLLSSTLSSSTSPKSTGATIIPRTPSLSMNNSNNNNNNIDLLSKNNGDNLRLTLKIKDSMENLSKSPVTVTDNVITGSPLTDNATTTIIKEGVIKIKNDIEIMETDYDLKEISTNLIGLEIIENNHNDLEVSQINQNNLEVIQTNNHNGLEMTQTDINELEVIQTNCNDLEVIQTNNHNGLEMTQNDHNGLEMTQKSLNDLEVIQTNNHNGLEMTQTDLNELEVIQTNCNDLEVIQTNNHNGLEMTQNDHNGLEMTQKDLNDLEVIQTNNHNGLEMTQRHLNELEVIQTNCNDLEVIQTNNHNGLEMTQNDLNDLEVIQTNNHNGLEMTQKDLDDLVVIQTNNHNGLEITQRDLNHLYVIKINMIDLSLNCNDRNSNNIFDKNIVENTNVIIDELDEEETINNNDLQRSSYERDSANHSPVDIILPGSSVSSLSDNHSEVDSHDSGQGGSELVTPPPGCSFANAEPENLLKVYEFVIQQSLVGKLIGKRGCFVQQIKNKTKSHIIVRKHPNDNNLKVCVIQGRQNEIDGALKLIRDRFPLKRYPDVTLEQVTFVPDTSKMSIVPEHAHLKLVEGINNDTILCCLVAPNHFFLQQVTHPTYIDLERHSNFMNAVYSETDGPLITKPVPENVVCAAYSVNSWYRAQILSTNVEDDVSYVKFLDCGGYAIVDNNMLRPIRLDFLTLPFQAAECYLANIKPASGNDNAVWAAEAYEFVAEITKSKIIYTQIIDYERELGIPLVYCYLNVGAKIVLLNEELVNRGYAEWVQTCSVEVNTNDDEEGAVGGIV